MWLCKICLGNLHLIIFMSTFTTEDWSQVIGYVMYFRICGLKPKSYSITINPVQSKTFQVS